ncbi:MAG: hypothetical protein IGS39_18720 [Calothrix sp. C42_A2020_038]|nr:hypothetical protein [Calothrix sp. C42_A2020_038]
MAHTPLTHLSLANMTVRATELGASYNVDKLAIATKESTNTKTRSASEHQ